MNYENAYKEALERMKSWARGEHPECFSEAQKAAEFVFPELAESEDVKIRKEMLNVFKQLDECTTICGRNYDYAKWIAWLEKQKYTQRDVDDAYLKGITDTKNILENRGKQTNFFQNVSLTEFEEALADVCRGWIGEEIGWKDYIIRNANALLKICQKMWNEVRDAPFEQKPTWSREDDEILKNLIDYFSLDAGLSLPTEETINWLKSLKDRLKGE